MHLNRSSILACALSFAGGLALACTQQQTQTQFETAAAKAPDSATATTRREPQFENDDVKVWKSIIMPKQPLNMHRHDHARALIALTDGKLNVLNDSGRVVSTYDWKAGTAYWLTADPPGVMHGDRNDTDKPIEVIVVELKKDK